MKQFRPNKFNWWDAPVGTMPRVYYGGGKSQTSTSQVSIPPEVLAQYQNVNSIANQVAQTPFQQYSQDSNAFVAPLTTTQQAGVLGTNQYASEAQPFYQKAANTNTPSGVMSYYNPEASQVSQLMEQQFNQAQSGQLGNAIQNGAFGGDRAAVTAANLQQQQGLAYGNAMAGIYQNAVGNSQNAANLEANIGAGAQSAGLAGAQAQLTAGQAQQQTEQAGLTALYNQFLQQQSYPFQTTQFLANIAEGTGALSGSTTTSNQPSPYFSDERLKDDIEPIGKTFDGLNIIKFRYKGSKQPHIGLSAQDVERTHPDAVGLAGGYKTVDYDEATRDAAERGRHSSHGGLVVPLPFRRTDGSMVSERGHFDVGGYAGLSPNSAWSGGFYLDPSYLQAQEAAYANAPWGNAGPVSGSAPYGGKSHVPPSMGGIHASLAVAKPPAQQNSSGLQQLSSGLGQLEKLGGQGKKLFNGVKGYVPGLAPSTTTATQPSSFMGNSTQGNPPPAPHQPPVTNDNAAPPSSNDASSGPIAGLDPGDLGSPDLSYLDLGDALTAERGGRIRRGLDAGGTPSFSQPTDAGQDDQSDSGAVPYESGTGSGGLDIPDDKSNNKLAVAQPPSSSGGGGGFNPLSLLGPVLGIFGLADGGRVGLAGGGSPDDSSDADLTLPSLGTDLDRQGLGLAPASRPVDMDYVNQGRRSLAQALGMSGYEDTANQSAPSAPVATYDDNSGGLGRDVVVHKAAPKQGLNPDAPAPAAAPVQMDVPTVPPGDFGPIPEGMRRPTTNTTVQPMAETPGAGDAARVGRGFFGGNQDWLVPLMHGLGTMASSNSRYLGSAILQGLGGAADSYENVQNEMMNRGLTGAGIQQGLAHAGETQANTGLTQGLTGKIQSETTGHILQNEQTRQALQNGDIFTDGNGNTIVKMPNGNMLWGDWASRGFPPTLHQVHTTAGTMVGAPENQVSPAFQPSKNHYSYLGNAGQGALSQDENMLRAFGTSPKGKALLDQSSKTEAAAQNAYESSIRNGSTLNQIASQISEMPASGAMAGGPLNNLRRAWIMHYNDVVNSTGHPDMQVDPDQIGTAIAADKLHAMMSFGMTHGMDQNSFGALVHANEANPSMSMPKTAAMKVMAGLYADKQQDIDRYNYLQEYKNEAASRPGALPTWYLAQNALQAFNRDHDQTQYGREKAAIEGILNAKNKNGPLLNQLYHGQLTPQQVYTLENGANGRPGWGPNIFRYFRND